METQIINFLKFWKKASPALLQRKFKLSYEEAVKYIELYGFKKKVKPPVSNS